ncbi:MFS transporter [Pseudoalteromonas rubra]|uniref:MFS transporter n=1 Tax=Pseudoalteromonas rubra TaxID=43658 RepID=UPI0013DDA218|nr:MFS transporter [Pseudoalteromonas rubra]
MSKLAAKIFVIGAFLSFLATQFLLFAIPLVVLKSEGSIASLGALLSIEWLPALFAFPLSGYLIDRYCALKVNRIAHFVRGCLCFISFFLLSAYPEYLFVNLSLLAGGCAFLLGFVRLSSDTVISLAFKEDEKSMAKYHSALQTAELSSMMIGASLAGLASMWFDTALLLLVAGATFLLAFMATLPVQVEQVRQTTKRQFVSSVKFGARYIRNSDTLKGIVLINFSLNLMVGVIIGLNPALVVSIFAMEDAYFGYLNMAGGLASVGALALIPVLLKQYSISRIGAFGCVLCISAALMMVGSADYYVYLSLYVTYLVGLALYNIYNRTQRAKVIPKADFGSVMGVFYVINMVSLPLSGLLIYLFAEQVAPLTIILSTALVTLCCVFVAYVLFLKNSHVELHKKSIGNI